MPEAREPANLSEASPELTGFEAAGPLSEGDLKSDRSCSAMSNCVQEGFPLNLRREEMPPLRGARPQPRLDCMLE
jgi:hypothetical protein